MPCWHDKQTDFDVAPASDEYLPAAHAKQADAPEMLEYVPGKQVVHVRTDVAPGTLENVPVLHARQLEADGADEYVPRLHKLQEDDRMVENDPGKQATHASLLVAAMRAEYDPASHAMQSFAVLEPSVDEYVPTSQF